MKNLIVSVLIAAFSSTSFAGYVCENGTDKWGGCDDFSPSGHQLYVDGMASCLHPCTLTDEQIIAKAEKDALRVAGNDMRCGFNMVRFEAWKVNIKETTEGERTWTLATVGALFTCKR